MFYEFVFFILPVVKIACLMLYYMTKLFNTVLESNRGLKVLYGIT
jgi:hypothetical protein